MDAWVGRGGRTLPLLFLYPHSGLLPFLPPLHKGLRFLSGFNFLDDIRAGSSNNLFDISAQRSPSLPLAASGSPFSAREHATLLGQAGSNTMSAPAPAPLTPVVAFFLLSLAASPLLAAASSQSVSKAGGAGHALQFRNTVVLKTDFKVSSRRMRNAVSCCLSAPPASPTRVHTTGLPHHGADVRGGLSYSTGFSHSLGQWQVTFLPGLSPACIQRSNAALDHAAAAGLDQHAGLLPLRSTPAPTLAGTHTWLLLISALALMH